MFRHAITRFLIPAETQVFYPLIAAREYTLPEADEPSSCEPADGTGETCFCSHCLAQLTR